MAKNEIMNERISEQNNFHRILISRLEVTPNDGDSNMLETHGQEVNRFVIVQDCHKMHKILAIRQWAQQNNVNLYLSGPRAQSGSICEGCFAIIKVRFGIKLHDLTMKKQEDEKCQKKTISQEERVLLIHEAAATISNETIRKIWAVMVKRMMPMLFKSRV